MAGFLAHNEVQYGREKKINPKSKLPVNCMAGVVNCFKIVEEEHGVDGWLGVGPYQTGPGQVVLDEVQRKRKRRVTCGQHLQTRPR